MASVTSKGKSPSITKQEDRWRTEEDLRCLQEAAAIRKDAKRLAACRALAKEKVAAMKNIAVKDTDNDGDG